jgi:fido (protein-threonine AMPylation protein)
MNDTSKKLAASLEQLKALQDKGVVAIQSKVLSRTHRERLIKNNFIKEVIKGWYIPSMPDDTPGDSTSWYTSYWTFCTAYLTERFDDDWCLSAEQSINLHIGDSAVPQQLLVRSPKGRNKPTEFLHDTSIFDVKLAMPSSSEITKMNGLNVYSLASAIVNCSKRHFTAHPTQIRTALSMVTDASEVLVILLKGGQSVVAGRIAGAFRNIGRDLIANSILRGMVAADYKIQEVNPFDDEPAITFGRRDVSPYVNRMRLMWASMREVVIANFQSTASKALSINAYMDEVEDKYIKDAYHSLSIEGYRVTPELIELVRSGDWNSGEIESNRHHLDALAAKGYWDAFQEVKKAVLRILKGENAGEVLEEVHSDWYFSLFGSSVAAGIIKQSDLAGYRNGPVYIRRSMHTPPSREALRDMMPTLFDLLIEEENPAVRVVLGHFFFVYIHPYFDGNGRMGRFLMNVMMASGGYSWTVVPVERRNDYMQSLEAASVHKNILPFTQFVSSLVY